MLSGPVLPRFKSITTQIFFPEFHDSRSEEVLAIAIAEACQNRPVTGHIESRCVEMDGGRDRALWQRRLHE